MATTYLVGVLAAFCGAIGVALSFMHLRVATNPKTDVTRYSQWGVSLNVAAGILLIAFLALYLSR